jgi:type I restriction enzyme, S subunit
VNSSWPSAPLARIVKPVERPEVPVGGTRYRQIGVKLWGIGAYEREPIDGTETRYNTLSRVETNDIIVNKIWARNGSVAVVPESLAGSYVSGEFPTFTPIPDKLEPQWFHWITKTRFFWDQCDAKSRGTSGKNRIRPERFLGIEIPLSPLPEQQRIVAQIEALASKINEARGLREKSAHEAEALVFRATSTMVDDAGWSNQQLGNVLTESPRNGLSPKREVETGGRGMLRINAVSSSPTRFVDLEALKMVEVQAKEAAPFELCYDDVFIVRYNGDINRVAKAAIYKGGEPRGIIFPDKLMRLRPDHSRMLPDFLVYALGSRGVRQQIEQLGKTTAGNIGISGANAKSFQVPVPPIQDQRRIVAELDALQSQVDALKKLQAETAAELDALLPSILDKAFKGEL